MHGCLLWLFLFSGEGASISTPDRGKVLPSGRVMGLGGGGAGGRDGEGNGFDFVRMTVTRGWVAPSREIDGHMDTITVMPPGTC